ncbi:M4 family metallopeptidase [Cloacibacterium normanense]|uniref:Neutral metalloproteinase n=1 Tax=Cloacibacterium normanense TaxID=237258 RepID=A0A1E5UCQ9_9FLAO|nr:M4 family metallopeptidase [Cloacibacterium normanense]AZI68565.1 M4 family peptidase [Cloacibacterium normanense]OEL10672.1 bacillolysin [Cloacibacterium normanense]SDO62598.1 Zn-dependent metalloprotease [Cloacibacterium normanense]
MKSKITLAASFLAVSFAFAQNTPSKLISGKSDMFAEHVRFDASKAPDFKGKPMVYDETAKQMKEVSGLKLSSDKDALGFENHKFQQTVNGIPVEYGMINMLVKKGKVVSQNGVWFKNVPATVEKRAGISEANALNSALAYVGATSYKWQNADEEAFLKSDTKDANATFYPKGKLVYYNDPADVNAKKLTLAYKFDVYASEPVSRQEVYVDAKTGKVLGTNALILETNAPGTAVTAYSGNQAIVADQVSATSYRLRETGRNGGTAVETYNLKQGTNYSRATDFTDTDNTWNNVNTSLDQYATDAHWGAEKTVDYLKAQFNRNSIDNNHFAIKSYVHYSRNYFNAFWDGSRMTYGDGSSTNGNKPLTALDVCAHEIGHGMTTKTANLVYQKESGALNEAFSDILGNSVEFWARPTKASWKLGEDFNYVIRDMANPNAYGDPDTYGGTYWVNPNCTPSSTNDYCGVHTNSGVLNFWYYLLVNGGSGTNDKGFAYNVTGVGLDKAAQIAYRTLTTYLTSTSTYANARTYSLQAAADLYGAGSAEVTQTTNAWNAVGVGGGTSPAGRVAADATTAPVYKVAANVDRVYINFESENAEMRNVELVSITGKKVAAKSAKVVQGANNVEVNIPAQVHPGVYYVLVNGQKVGSFIKK